MATGEKVGIKKMGSPESDCINNEREKDSQRLFFFFSREREKREGVDDDYNESFIHACKCF